MSALSGIINVFDSIVPMLRIIERFSGARSRNSRNVRERYEKLERTEMSQRPTPAFPIISALLTSNFANYTSADGSGEFFCFSYGSSKLIVAGYSGNFRHDAKG